MQCRVMRRPLALKKCTGSYQSTQNPRYIHDHLFEIDYRTSSDDHSQNTPSPAVPVSGTESDSDSVPQDILSNVVPLSSIGASGSLKSGTPTNAPLTSIAERRSGSGDESEEDEDEEEEGGWKTADVRGKPRGSADETVIKAGYLSKKGERRKVCLCL